MNCFKIFSSVTLLSVAPQLQAAPNEQGRILTREECARMERFVPDIADYIGMRGDRQKLIKEGKNGDFPEAFEAMVWWVSQWDIESLLRHNYRLAPKFFDECTSGKVRTSS